MSDSGNSVTANSADDSGTGAALYMRIGDYLVLLQSRGLQIKAGRPQLVAVPASALTPDVLATFSPAEVKGLTNDLLEMVAVLERESDELWRLEHATDPKRHTAEWQRHYEGLLGVFMDRVTAYCALASTEIPVQEPSE